MAGLLLVGSAGSFKKLLLLIGRVTFW